MDFSSITDLSVEPSSTRHLTDVQKQRLTVLLDQYLIGLETGAPPVIEELAAGDRALEEALRSYVAGLERLHQIAAGFVPHAESAGDDSASSNDETQRRLGDFSLMEEIGRGGMGVVYRARQTSLDRIVAVKLLPFAAVLDGRQIARFRNEAQAAAQLHHPNIVPVYAIGAERGVHYFAMQLISGQSLDQLIASRRETLDSIEIETCVTFAIQIADALHAAHEFGVVHRDIKPSNIMLDDLNKVWVTDFGLARCQTDGSLTKSGDVVGTMKYMSPEQARGESALVDGRTDVYSLGATLYELLALEPALDGGDAPAILRLVDEHEPRQLRKIRAEIPRDLDTVVSKAMSKSRDDRYETARLFAEDLRRVLSGEPTIARPPTILDRVSYWAQRHRSFVYGTFAVLVMALIGFAVSNARIAAERNWRKESEEHARGAVDRLGAQMAELLADIPAADSVRRQLLTDTITYYEEFVTRASGDPRLTHDLAVTYGKIGSLQRELGANDDSVAALVESERLFAKLAEAEPHDAQIRQEHATIENNLGLSLQQVGRFDKARRSYESAIGQQRALNNLKPDNVSIISELALSLNNLALLLSAEGKREESEVVYRESVEILESAESASNSTEIAAQLSATRNNLSGLLVKSNPMESARLANNAIKSQLQAMKQTPSNPRLATRVALTLNNLGAAQAELNQLELALDSYQQAVDIHTQLLERWPDQLSYHRDAAVSWNNFGLGLTKQARYNDAEHAFEQALKHHRTVLANFEHDAGLQSTIGGIYNNLAFAHERLNKHDEAMAAYKKAIDHQSKAYQASAKKSYQEYLSKHYYNYARLLRSERKWVSAMQTTLARRNLWEGDGERLAGVAEELLSAALERQQMPARSNDSSVVSTADCVDYAKETLQMAIAAGNDSASDLLNRPEYRSLLTDSGLKGT